MSTAMMMERHAATAHHMGHMHTATTPASMPHMHMVPRCTFKVEKCAGGMKLHCHAEDEVACGAMQQLCKMLEGGMCNCCCMLNGMCVFQCNLLMGMCHCEQTKDGVCITCKSGDKACCDMIQACCDCLSKCLESGCCCYVSMAGTPACCGCC